MIASAVTLLPQPDSPTTASVSPRASVKLTSSSTRATPLRVRNSTPRPSTDSSGNSVIAAFIAGAAWG